MDPPPPPPPATNPILTSVPHASYADSVESSPRSRTTETWDDRDSLAGGGGGGKLRLMCSFGGHIIPRPHDKSLCYVGGETRMVVVDRGSSLGELKARLSRTLLNNRAFTLKYQLPNEDLDSLISVTTDEDLENMIDEFDRICRSSSGAKSSRLRVFLFVNKLDSGSSIESILDSSVKSEDWFYSVLNSSGASARGLADVNSVNSLLGLENDSAVLNNGGNLRSGNPRELEALQSDLSKNQKLSNQDAQLNPDLLMIDTSSSFGSTSSSPSLANLPPIRVRVEGGGMNKVRDQRGAVEEQFAQMNVSAGGKKDEGFAAMASPPQIPTTLVPPMAVSGVPVNPGMSGISERIVSDDERSDQGVSVGIVRSQPQLQAQPQQQQQKPSGIFGIASPDSASSDGSMFHPDPFGQVPSGIARVTSNPMDSNNLRIPVQQKAPESGYVLNSQLAQQQQLQQQQQQQQQQNPQQFIHPGTHYIQHPQNAVPVPHYYHIYPPPTQHRQPQHDQQQYPLYFIPPTATQPQQAYSMSMQQAATYGEPSIAVPSSHPQNTHVPTMLTNSSAYNSQPGNLAPVKPEMASNSYRSPILNAQPMVQVAPGQVQQQYVGYSQVQHPPQSMAQPQIPAPTSNANFTYEYSDPAHSQIYYTQPLAPTYPAQYQTVVSSSPMVMLPDVPSVQNLNDNMKQQIRPPQAQ